MTWWTKPAPSCAAPEDAGVLAAPGMLRSLPFRLKLFTLAACALVALAAALTMIQDRLVLKVLEAQFESRAAAARPILQAALAAPLAERDFATIQAIITESVNAGSFAHMVLLDAGGQPVAAAGWNVARDGTPQYQGRPLAMPDGDSRMVYETPVSLAGQRLGTVHFGMSLAPIEAAHAALVTGGVVAAILCVALMVPVVELGSRWLFRPLKRLEAAAAAIRGGDYDTPLDPRALRATVAREGGGDEIARLGSTFIAMAGAMRERLEALSASEARQRALLEEARLREALLRTAKEQAEVATRAKSEFLANMSHEVRTPLNGILGMAQILAASELNEADREAVQVILDSGNLLLGIINDILDISRLESGRVKIEVASVDTVPMLSQPLSALAAAALRKGVGWTVELAPDLPRQVMADRMRVAQVLVNLAGNAVKFTESGQIRIRARWLQLPAGGRLRVEVADTGIGIPRESWPQLFERFAQAEMSTTRRYGGSGLGLAISRQLVELMDGRIGFDSQPGQGSTFWFELPLGLPALARMEAAGGRRVLVVEALPSHRTAASALLRQLDHAVTTVGDGKAAEAALRDQAFDVVMLDLDGPEGWETASRLLGMTKGQARVPIIGTSEQPDTALRERCGVAGLAGLLGKPMRLRDLHPAIQTAVAEAAAR
jgi:two-component system, sensor histidine kinase